MDFKEKFRFKNVKLSSKQENNIKSNWLLILGGLKEFKKQNKINELNKYGIIHMVRQIDGYHYYAITQKLFILLENELPEEELNILKKDTGFTMNSSLRTKFNKFLKQKNVKDSIQIEHLNGGVKTLVERIIDTELSLNKIKELHREHTLCCYKLKSESEINEGTNLSEINLALKQ